MDLFFPDTKNKRMKELFQREREKERVTEKKGARNKQRILGMHTRGKQGVV